MESKSLQFQIEVQLPPNRTKASFIEALEEEKWLLTSSGWTITILLPGNSNITKHYAS